MFRFGSRFFRERRAVCLISDTRYTTDGPKEGDNFADAVRYGRRAVYPLVIVLN